MGSLLSVIPVVIRRIAANVRLLLAVVIGAVLASALMSTTSIYTDTIRDLGLTFAIRSQGADTINIAVRGNSQSSIEETYRQNRDFIETSAKQGIGPLVRSQMTHIGRGATFYPTAPGLPVPVEETRPRSHLQFVTGIESHVKVVDGKLPADAPAYSEGQRAPSIEVAIGKETAERAGVRVGQTFDLHPFWRLEGQPVRATVAGIIEADDPLEAFWRGETTLFTFQSTNWITMPLFVTEATYFKTVAAYLPTMTADYQTFIYLSTSPINARNAESVRASVEGFDRQIESQLQRYTAETELPAVLATFDEKLFFTRIPLLVLVLQIAGIVLYYLFMVSTMLVERQGSEIALLKSRGATTWQVMHIYIIEGLLITLLALALGPPLAALLISLLGHTPPFADLSGGASLSVRLTGDAYLWASAGALAAYATLLWPAYQATKRTVVQQRTASARPPKQAVFTRYYLDVVLVAVGGLLFYQLDRRGTLVNEKLFGEQTVDPLLLLTPAFFILTVGIVFLRLFPVVLRMLAWIVARMRGTAVLIGMWQLVRNPTHYSRLVLLLMLATAVGMFAASFGTTLNRSYSDRASYESGAQLRLTAVRRSAAPGPVQFAPQLAESLGATVASPVIRLNGSQGQVIDRVSVDVLGVDPETFGEVARYREDFSQTSLDDMLATLAEDKPDAEGVALPAGARWLGVWVNPVDLRGRVGLDAEVRDATGRYFTINLGPDAGLELTPGWVFMAGDLTRGSPGNGLPPVQFPASAPVEPMTLQSVNVRFITRVSALTGTMILDDLQAGPDIQGPLGQSRAQVDPTRSLGGLPGATIVADFEDVTKWAPLQHILPVKLQDEARSVPSGGAGNAIQLSWRPVPGQPSTHGLRPASTDRPLQAIASEGFLTEANLKVGDKTSVFLAGSFLEFEIVDSFRLFPTMKDTRTTAAVVVSGPRLLSLLNANPRTPPSVADEVWMSGGREILTEAKRAQADGSLQGTVISFDELRTAQQKDPLVAAGWEGILFLSFAAILLLSAIGFLIYSYLTAQKRTLEFAVLRTMGFSRRQIAAVVGFEQAFVIGLGMIAGTLMGLRLGSLMIRYMGVTETGDEVLPPMILHVSWTTIATAWFALALVFALTIGIVVLLYSRLALHRVLRIGET